MTNELKSFIAILFVLAACSNIPPPDAPKVQNQLGEETILEYFKLILPDGRTLECIGANFDGHSSFLDCNWNQLND